MIEKKDVTGPLASAYIHEQFLRGRFLSRGLKNLPIENGKIFAFVPSWIAPEKLYAFQNGGIYASDEELKQREHPWSAIRNDALSPICEEIERYIRVEKSNCCLFEDPILWPSDSQVKNNNIEFVYLGEDQVYYFFNNSNFNFEKIKEAVLVSDDYIFTCAISSLDINMQSCFLPSKEITVELLEAFVRNVFVFFVGAYDGEGYLMWVREK
jgi:hypothetical protein